MKQAETPLTERRVVRRGLIAGLAGFGAAALVKLQGAGKVTAANGQSVILGQFNDATAATILTIDIGNTPSLLAVNAVNWSFGGPHGIAGLTNKTTGYAAGLRGRHLGAGVAAGIVGDTLDLQGVGVIGRSGPIDQATSIPRARMGVQGQCTAIDGAGTAGLNSGNGTGVYGVSNATSLAATGDGSGQGVHGKTGTGHGVLGEATSTSGGTGVRGTSAGNGTGVRGVSNSGTDIAALGTGSGVGVQGRSGSGPGVEGISTNGLGVRGISTNFTAMVGISTNNHGLYGSTSNAASAGFVGENLAGGLAGYFAGNVFVTGSLQVAGGKNAVLKMQDGTLASVYCQESPEPYFEDFGRAQLVAGVANVQLDREFAHLVAGGDYMVFPVPEGDTRGLYVNRRGPNGFEVREQQGGTSSVAFTYRIVTKRKDIEGRRFARVTDTVAPGLAAARAAMGVTGTPPVNNTPPNPAPPLPFVPPSGAPAPLPPQPSPLNPPESGPSLIPPLPPGP